MASHPTWCTPTPISRRPSRARRTRSSSTRASAASRVAALRRGVGVRPGRRGRRGAGAQHQGRQRARRDHPDGPAGLVEQLDRVTGHINSGRDEGAGDIGGERVGDKGYCASPTVLTGTREEMKAVQEEIFARCRQALFTPTRTSCPRPTTPTTACAGCSPATSARPTPRVGCGRAVWVNTERLRRQPALRRLQGVGLGREMGHAVFNNYMRPDRHHRPERGRPRCRRARRGQSSSTARVRDDRLWALRTAGRIVRANARAGSSACPICWRWLAWLTTARPRWSLRRRARAPSATPGWRAPRRPSASPSS